MAVSQPSKSICKLALYSQRRIETRALQGAGECVLALSDANETAIGPCSACRFQVLKVAEQVSPKAERSWQSRTDEQVWRAQASCDLRRAGQSREYLCGQAAADDGSQDRRRLANDPTAGLGTVLLPNQHPAPATRPLTPTTQSSAA